MSSFPGNKWEWSFPAPITWLILEAQRLPAQSGFLLSGSSLSCLEVIETDPEPAHAVLEKSSREVELRLSAVVDYAEFKLDVDAIQFKETLLFQTRIFR